MNKTIEVELRSFLTQKQYQYLKTYFNKNAKLISKDFQETHYLNTKQDTRVQKSNCYSKIWQKSGKIHDDAREEIEIKFDKKEFDNILRIFGNIEVKTKIIWLRHRLEYRWNNIKVCLDKTKGYGNILELEKMSSQANKSKTLELLKSKFTSLNIDQTPKEIFDKKFIYYQNNWKKLI